MSRISSVIWMRGDHSGRPEVCTVTVFGRAAPSCASSCLIERSWPIKRISDRAIGRVLDVEQAHPFVGMQLADLRQLSLPRLWGRRSPRGSLVHPRRACRRVKFLAASWYGRAEGFVSPLVTLSRRGGVGRRIGRCSWQGRGTTDGSSGSSSYRRAQVFVVRAGRSRHRSHCSGSRTSASTACSATASNTTSSPRRTSAGSAARAERSAKSDDRADKAIDRICRRAGLSVRMDTSTAASTRERMRSRAIHHTRATRCGASSLRRASSETRMSLFAR